MRERQKERALLLFAWFHLAVIAAGAAQFHPSESLAPAISTYGAWTGTDSGYGFFAPTVPAQIMVYATPGSPESAQTRREFRLGWHEPDLRVTSLFFALARLQLHDLMARTTAAYVLGTSRDLPDVTVEIGSFDVPAMADYRRGRRCSVAIFYTGEFRRRAH
jgi:hypothetical protein